MLANLLYMLALSRHLIQTVLFGFVLEICFCDLLNQSLLQNEEKQELAAASLDYNMTHAQLKTMFQSELQGAKSGNTQHDQPQPAQPPKESQTGEASSSQAPLADTSSTHGADSMQQLDAAAAESQVERLEAVQLEDQGPTHSNHAVPTSIQSAALDMLQKQLAEGLPEEALKQIEAALKYVHITQWLCINCMAAALLISYVPA